MNRGKNRSSKLIRRSNKFLPPSSEKEFSFSRRETYRALTALHKLRTRRAGKFITTLSLSIISLFLSFFLPSSAFIDRLDFNRASFHSTERKSRTRGEGHAFFSAHEFSRSTVNEDDDRRPATWPRAFRLNDRPRVPF